MLVLVFYLLSIPMFLTLLLFAVVALLGTIGKVHQAMHGATRTRKTLSFASQQALRKKWLRDPVAGEDFRQWMQRVYPEHCEAGVRSSRKGKTMAAGGAKGSGARARTLR